MTGLLKGECLCGAVKFSGTPDHGITICHCGQCRAWGAGPFMEVDMSGGVTFESDDTLTWYRSSEKGERGFCSRCGSTLFWREPGATGVSVSVNALQDDHGLKMRAHIWVDDKPDWYDFADDAPRLTSTQHGGGW